MSRMTYQEASPAGLYERLHVESWSPEYGAPLEPAEEAAEAPPADPSVETAEWRPLDGGGGQAPPEVAFVDGVRRIEARLTFDHPTEGPVPGVMGAFGVGAAVWDRKAGRSSFAGLSVERMVVMAKGFRLEVEGVGGLPAAGESIPGDDPSDLLSHLQQRMRAAEGVLASSLAGSGRLVIADGPFREPGPRLIAGYIKSHRVMYLDAGHRALIGRLRAGQRTPLFLIDAERHPRYSWYLRLADLPGGHSWTGIARCEVSASLGVGPAAELAGWTAALLPALSSEGHIDRRAPQNLVPIAALERELRRRMGNQVLADRALRSAVRAGARAGG